MIGKLFSFPHPSSNPSPRPVTVSLHVSPGGSSNAYGISSTSPSASFSGPSPSAAAPHFARTDGGVFASNTTSSSARVGAQLPKNSGLFHPCAASNSSSDAAPAFCPSTIAAGDPPTTWNSTNVTSTTPATVGMACKRRRKR